MKNLILAFTVLTTFPIFAAEEQDAITVSKSSCENVMDDLKDHARRARYYTTLPKHLIEAFASNMRMVYELLLLTKKTPMPGGLIPEDHPWVTGLIPGSQTPIWYKNVIYSIEPDQKYDQSDEQMIKTLATFLKNQAARSAATKQYPQGLPETDNEFKTLRRMPHTVNYIHGTSHYNSGWIVLNDFRDAYRVFSDKRFVHDLKRFAETEEREIIIVFRNSDYDPIAYGQLSMFLRTILPWYSNVNGPQEQVHWGNKTAVTAINMITGNFAKDLKKLQEPEGYKYVVKPPIDASLYFSESYGGARKGPRWAERLLAKAIQFRVNARGPRKGTMFFVDKAKLDLIKRKRELKVEATKSADLKIEDFYQQAILVHDLSAQVDDKGQIPLPADFDPEHDIIYALKSDDTGHTFLIAGEAELHASVAFKRETRVIRPNEDRIGAWVFVVIKDLPREVVQRTESAIRQLQDTHAICCVAGAEAALEEGAEINMPEGMRTGIAPIRTLRRIIKYGLTTTGDKPVRIEVYKASEEPIEQLFERLKVQDAKLLAAYPLLVPIGHILDTLAPDKKVLLK